MLIEQAVAIMLLLNMVTTGWRKLAMRVCDPHRPELHYLRGPGPRWRAKHEAGI
jgi:hypothetical protein